MNSGIAHFMVRIWKRWYFSVPFSTALFTGMVMALSHGYAHADVLSNWNIASLTSGSPGVGGALSPASTASDVNVGTLTLGSGVVAQSAASTFGANSWDENTSEAGAIAGNDFVYFTLTADNGFTASISSISPYNIRRSGTGPNTGIWQYEVGNGPFVDIGSSLSWSSTATTGNPESSIDLSGISALQNVASGSTVTFRLVNWGDTGSGGTWYINGTGTNGGNLIINGAINPYIAPGTALFWTADGSTLGGSSTWSTTTPGRWSASDTSVSGMVWDSSKTAVFEGTPGTVTVAAGGITLNPSSGPAMVFNTGGFSVVGDSLTLASSLASISVTNAGDSAVIGSQLVTDYGLTKYGQGTLILTVNNTYNGGTTISAGTLQIGNGGTTGSITGDVTSNGTLAFDRSDTYTFSGAINGGTLTQAGGPSSTLIINGAAAPLVTNVVSGTLQVGDGSTSGAILGSDPSSTINVSSGATLKYNHLDGFTVAGTILGPGNIEQSGAGTATFTGTLGSNTTPVNVVIDLGSTFQLGDGGLTTGGTLYGSVNNNGTLIYNLAGNVTLPGDVTGNGSIQKDGAGVVSVTGNFAHTGGTTINSGTLQIGNGGTSGSITGDITNNGILAFNRSDDIEYHGNISGGGPVNIAGSGAVTLSGANSYQGGTNVSSGIVRAATNSSFGNPSGAVNVTSGTVFANAGVTIPNHININSTGGTSGILLAGWTFETSQPTGPGPFTAEEGVSANSSSAFCYHSNAAAVFSQNVGNGSAHSFSSSNWTQNDYYQFSANISGYSSLSLSWDQTGSNTGPRDFTLQYSTDGTTFNSVPSSDYTLTNDSWSGTTYNPASTHTIDLGDLNLNGATTIYLRMLNYDMTSITGNLVGTTGTDRVDNVDIYGNPTNGSGPLPSAVLGSDITSGSTIYASDITLNSAVALSSAGGGTVYFNGAISDGSRPGNVVKIGDGTVVLNTQSSYTGVTAVNQGRLVLGVSNALTGTSGVTLTGGTLATNGLAQDFTTSARSTALTVLSDSELDLGTATSSTSVKFADSHAGASSVWTGMLNITGWTFGTDHLYFGSSSTGLNSEQLSDINFADFAQGASISSTGEVTPLLGDINQDGHVNASDIVALEQALANPTGYASLHPTLSPSDISFLLDVNGNGQVNNGDLQALINYLIAGNGSTSPVPEPTSLFLLGFASALLLAGRRPRIMHYFAQLPKIASAYAVRTDGIIT